MTRHIKPSICHRQHRTCACTRQPQPPLYTQQASSNQDRLPRRHNVVSPPVPRPHPYLPRALSCIPSHGTQSTASPHDRESPVPTRCTPPTKRQPALCLSAPSRTATPHFERHTRGHSPVTPAVANPAPTFPHSPDPNTQPVLRNGSSPSNPLHCLLYSPQKNRLDPYRFAQKGRLSQIEL